MTTYILLMPTSKWYCVLNLLSIKTDSIERPKKCTEKSLCNVWLPLLNDVILITYRFW